jgi:hypothetical protein
MGEQNGRRSRQERWLAYLRSRDLTLARLPSDTLLHKCGCLARLGSSGNAMGRLVGKARSTQVET